jgi:hypothetical protein
METANHKAAISHPPITLGVAAVQCAILRYLEETTERRGAIERLPGLPGAKRPDEEVVLVGFPF